MNSLLQQHQNLGWHLKSIDGYPLNGQAMYAAIWDEGNSPDTRKITIGKSWVDFQQEQNENVGLGMFSQDLLRYGRNTRPNLILGSFDLGAKKGD